jgi:hypothetical protein
MANGFRWRRPAEVASKARQRLQEINKDARDEVERTLRTAIKDDIVVGQLTTAVVRFG